jgi:hypothetical protein
MKGRMSVIPILTLAVCLLMAGCGPPPPPETPNTPKPQESKTDQQHLRRALGNIKAYLADLEGRLRISSAQTWRLEASAAQQAVGNIRIELGALRTGSINVGNLESLLSELEGSLRGASAENWSQDASAARQIVGSIQLELQALSRGL